MFLNLLTKFAFIFLLLTSFIAIAQNQNDSLNKVGASNSNNRHFNTEITGILPFAVGDNFASKGLNLRYGLDFNFRGYFNDNIFFGLKFQHLRADVTDETLVGSYEHSNVNSSIFMGGYRFDFHDNFYVEPYLGYGLTTYNNKKTSTTFEDLDFEDTANSLITGLSFVYKLSKNINLFLTPEYRVDFTKIKTSSERQSFFDEAKFINLLVGLRFGY